MMTMIKWQLALLIKRIRGDAEPPQRIINNYL